MRDTRRGQQRMIVGFIFAAPVLDASRTTRADPGARWTFGFGRLEITTPPKVSNRVFGQKKVVGEGKKRSRSGLPSDFRASAAVWQPSGAAVATFS